MYVMDTYITDINPESGNHVLTGVSGQEKLVTMVMVYMYICIQCSYVLVMLLTLNHYTADCKKVVANVIDH